MDLKNKKTLVIGLGATGLATAVFLKRRGARVTVSDSAPEAELQENASRLRELGIKLELGRHSRDTFQAADFIVISPGVPHLLGPVAEARSNGTPVYGEIELACRFIDEPMVAVTGTNGKTTTTTLIGDMLKASQKTAFVGGNIGDPLIGYVDRGQRADVLVVEVSSFQLDTIQRFRPDIAVLLNITEDHLDRYADFTAYAESKMRIFENQHAEDLAVINGADTTIGPYLNRIKCRKLLFAPASAALPEDTFGCALLSEDRITITGLPDVPGRKNQKPNERHLAVARSDIRLFGAHNMENAAAAALAAFSAGATPKGIRQALKSFKGLAHRLETLGRYNDVRFINDSKATNMGAVIRALASFTEPVVLLLGGRNKGGNFHDLAASIRRHVKSIVAFGESRQEIVAALTDAAPIETAADMQAAVSKAFKTALPGETVLLSPGCASFDHYDNYVQRGEDFRRAVAELTHPNKPNRHDSKDR